MRDRFDTTSASDNNTATPDPAFEPLATTIGGHGGDRDAMPASSDAIVVAQATPDSATDGTSVATTDGADPASPMTPESLFAEAVAQGLLPADADPNDPEVQGVLEQLMADLTGNLPEPAAGPDAGPDATPDPNQGGGANFNPNDPGDLADGLGVSDLLDPTGLQFGLIDVEVTPEEEGTDTTTGSAFAASSAGTTVDSDGGGGALSASGAVAHDESAGIDFAVNDVNPPPGVVASLIGSARAGNLPTPIGAARTTLNVVDETGSDSPPTVTFAAYDGAPTGMTTGGTAAPQEIFLFRDDNDPSVVWGRTETGEVVFAAKLGDGAGGAAAGTPVVTYVQFLAINHPVAGENDPNADPNPHNDPVAMSLDVVVVAGDGSTGGGSISVTVLDSGPTALGDQDGIVEDAGGALVATGNVISGDDVDAPGVDTMGSDGGQVQAFYAGTQAPAQTTAAGGEVKGLYGTLTLNADGSYSYQVDPNLQTRFDTGAYSAADVGGGIASITKDGITVSVLDPANGEFTYVDKEGTGLGIDGGPGDSSLKVFDSDSIEKLLISFDTPVQRATITLGDIGVGDAGDGLDYLVRFADGTTEVRELQLPNPSPADHFVTFFVDVTQFTGKTAITSVELFSDATVGNPAWGTSSFTLTGVTAEIRPAEVFTYIVEDGDGDTATAVLELDGVAPGAAVNARMDTATTSQDGPATVSVLQNDSGPLALNVIAATVTSGGGSVAINGDGTLTYDPGTAFQALAEGETGQATVEYTISDGNGGTDTATVIVTVTGANDDPVAQDDTAAGNANGPVTFAVLGNDSDPDNGDTLSVTGASVTNGLGSVSVNQDGTLRYDPGVAYQSLAAGETANVEISYTIEDGNGGSDTATATVTVTGVNDAPVAQNDTAVGDEDTVTIINVLGNDSDIDATDVLTVTGATVTDGLGTVSINPDGTLSYDPGDAYQTLAAGESAEVMIKYTISDGNGGTDTATVGLTVNGVADAGRTVTLSDPSLLLSTSGNATVAGVENPATLDDADIGFFDGTDFSRAWLGNISDRLDGISVNAASVRANGNIVFAAAAGGTLEGVGSFTTSDLIEWDAATNTFSKLFTGVDSGLTLGIDAVHIYEDGSFVFSVNNTGVIAGSVWPAGGATLRGNQLWQYDPDAVGEKFSLVFDGDGEGLSSLPNENIDAVYMRADGTAVISVTGNGSVFDENGNVLNFEDEDLVAFDPAAGNGTFSLLFDGSEFGLTTSFEDVKAAHLFEGDAISGDTAVGRDGDDLLIGNNEANTLDGAGGNDVLFGAGGDDTLLGNDGDDILYSEQGNDTLIGGRGADVMHGDSGGEFANTFKYTDLDEGGDTIINFDLHSSAAELNADSVDLSELFSDVADASGKSAQDLIDEGFITVSTGSWDQGTGQFTDGAGSDSRLSISINGQGEIDADGTQEVLLAAFVDRTVLTPEDIVVAATVV